MSGFVPAIGSVRRSQGVFTFGVGSIVDLRKGSFMPLGLKQMEWQWSGLTEEARDEITFFEPRLQRLLQVHEFRGYPIPGEHQISEFGDKVKKAWGVPCVRFPEWLECPSCHRLGKEGDPFETEPDGAVVCNPCKRGTTPVRFVVACRRHHIADFPWVAWTHTKSQVCARPTLTLLSHGRSAALSDLYVKCSCGAQEGLGSIFQPRALSAWRCEGKRPWLQLGSRCSLPVETLQRGASNVHFGITASMLSIPPASEAIARILERHWMTLKHVPEVSLEGTLRGLLANEPVDITSAMEWVRRRKKAEDEPGGGSEVSCRDQEFRTLSLPCAGASQGHHAAEFENELVEPPDDLADWFDLAAAVRRLREVRALCGFTRIRDLAVSVEQIPEELNKGTIAPLSAQPLGWLPAVEVRGEGIFLRFREERVAAWLASDPGAVARAKTIDSILVRESEQAGTRRPFEITARLLLVHGFAHALIRRLALDCGYSSASLRERLYVSEGNGTVPAMAGLLVYTASPDSDGSLGGLVSLAITDRLGDLIRCAAADLRWCGSDPVCIETDPAVLGERHSGSACHGCLLLPETACERFNRELDRAILVGTPDEAVRGFLSGFPSARAGEE